MNTHTHFSEQLEIGYLFYNFVNVVQSTTISIYLHVYKTLKQKEISGQ